MRSVTAWRTKKGLLIEAVNMKDSHLINTIHFIEKRAVFYAFKLRLFELDNISKSYDSADNSSQIAMDDIIESLALNTDLEIVKHYHKPYLSMVEEYSKRSELRGCKKCGGLNIYKEIVITKDGYSGNDGVDMACACIDCKDEWNE